MADTVQPLATVADMTVGPFADLVSGITTDALQAFLGEATREVEDICDRRLAPFTNLTETTRASGIDPDEYASSGTMPMSIQGTIGASYASALSIQNLVRHTWIAQYPPRYPDLWTMSPSITVTVVTSYGGVLQIGTGQILDGPDDSGHIWFELGMFIPIGSRIRVTYSGGYTVATPASLSRSCKYMAASHVVRELNPDDSQHNPDQLRAEAVRILADGKWVRF